MADLRIFSYLPNPRLWKATIAARLCGVDVEVRGSKPKELQNWLWDFDARPLTEEERRTPQDTARQGRTGFKGQLFKTDAFLAAHPFGTVPAAFSPDGSVGIFESNSIARAVARLGQDRYPIYGDDAYAAARIDSFLDVSLIFARDSQIYLLAMGSDRLTPDIHARAQAAFATYMGGIEQALTANRQFLVGNGVTLADICFVAEYSLFSRERAQGSMLARLGLQHIINDATEQHYPGALAHYARLCAHPAFIDDVAPYLAKIENVKQAAAE